MAFAENHGHLGAGFRKLRYELVTIGLTDYEGVPFRKVIIQMDTGGGPFMPFASRLLLCMEGWHRTRRRGSRLRLLGTDLKTGFITGHKLHDLAKLTTGCLPRKFYSFVPARNQWLRRSPDKGGSPQGHSATTRWAAYAICVYDNAVLGVEARVRIEPDRHGIFTDLSACLGTAARRRVASEKRQWVANAKFKTASSYNNACRSPLNHGINCISPWSGKWDSNPRLRPWQGRTLPLSYSLHGCCCCAFLTIAQNGL